MKTPLLVRIAIIAGTALLVLLPIALIQGKISERRARAEGVVAQFAQGTSGPQLLAGPLLADDGMPHRLFRAAVPQGLGGRAGREPVPWHLQDPDVSRGARRFGGARFASAAEERGHALLMGSIMVFAALALAMVSTRRGLGGCPGAVGTPQVGAV